MLIFLRLCPVLSEYVIFIFQSQTACWISHGLVLFLERIFFCSFHVQLLTDVLTVLLHLQVVCGHVILFVTAFQLIVSDQIVGLISVPPFLSSSYVHTFSIHSRYSFASAIYTFMHLSFIELPSASAWLQCITVEWPADFLFTQSGYVFVLSQLPKYQIITFYLLCTESMSLFLFIAPQLIVHLQQRGHQYRLECLSW